MSKKNKSSTIPLLKDSWGIWFFDPCLVFLTPDLVVLTPDQGKKISKFILHLQKLVRYIEAYPNASKVFGGKQTTRTMFFRCTKKKKKNIPNSEGIPQFGLSTFCCLEFFVLGFLRVEPLAEIISLKVRKLANYILVVSQCWQSAPAWNFLKPVLGPFLLLPPHFEEKNKWASNLFCKTENHFPELLFATKKTTGGFPFTPFVKPPGR